MFLKALGKILLHFKNTFAEEMNKYVDQHTDRKFKCYNIIHHLKACVFKLVHFCP